MTMTRRRFMGWMGAAAAGSLVPGVAVGARPDKQFSGHVNSPGVLHDITRCIGCRRCEAACNRVHELQSPERPFRRSDGAWINPPHPSPGLHGGQPVCTADGRSGGRRFPERQ
jgi:ferredoxin